MELKKSTKRFTVSTEAPNKRNFRVRTEGINIGPYALNPLMLWMHQRPKGTSKEEILPLGNFLNIEMSDGKLYGYPAFDPSDEFAMTIHNKVENGTIRMASAGLMPLDWRDVDGEIWLWDSELVEISICDIGVNPEALSVALYDADNKLIQLSAEFFDTLNLTPKSNIDMKMIQLSADILPLIGLAEGAKPEEAQSKIAELVTLTVDQNKQLITLAAEKKEAEDKAAGLQTKLDEQVNLAFETKVITLTDEGERARKYTADQKAHFVKLARIDYEGTKALIDSMPSAPTAASFVEKEKEAVNAEFVKLSWDEMDKKDGMLMKCKLADFELFKMKYKEKFNKEYPG